MKSGEHWLSLASGSFISGLRFENVKLRLYKTLVCLRLGAFTVVILKSPVFYDTTKCGLMKITVSTEHVAPRWRWHVPPKYRLTFNRLYGVISRKIGIFITSAVRDFIC
jgi:hypothetical protein